MKLLAGIRTCPSPVSLGVGSFPRSHFSITHAIQPLSGNQSHCPKLSLSPFIPLMSGCIQVQLDSVSHRYFINDTVVVRTVRTIQRGEPVTENYGAVFTQSGKEERQAYLKSRYWFDCQCEACLDDWPLFINLSRDNLSFRCQNCRSYLCKTTTESFNLLLRCSRCLKPTNMLQSLKSLEKSEGKFNQATECMNQGKRETAAGILLENMSLFDSILLPPFPDYHWCQEGLRKCYLPMGNQCNSLKLSSPPAGGSTTIVG